MKIFAYDDITGDGAKHQLITLLKVGGVAVPTQANWDTKWFQLLMLTSTGVSRQGDSNVSATNGIPIGSPAAGMFSPPIAFATEKYELSDVYVIIKSGDVMSVARGV